MAIIYHDNAQLQVELKKLMLENATTQRAIAERLGLSPQGLQKMMGKKNFGFQDAQKILTAMGYELAFDFVPKEPGAEKSE